MSRARDRADSSPTISGDLTVSGDLVPSTPLSHRNMIINGGMQVAQRGTSATSVTTNGYRTADRFQVRATNNGTWTVTQESFADMDGFRNSIKLQCTSTGSSGDTGRNLAIWYSFEGQDVQHLRKGTASAKSVTLQFWIKAYEAGNYRINLQDIDNDRIIGATYTINSSATWEKKTVTFAGDSTGAFGNDNGESLRVQWWLDSGSAYTGGAVPTAWEARASADENHGGHTTADDSTNNYFELTGIQLELGSNATPFEHRSYGDELIRCQRYYEEFTTGGLLWGFCIQTNAGGGYRRAPVKFLVGKRATPTVTSTSSDTIFGNDQIGLGGFTVMWNSADEGHYKTCTGWTATAEL